MMRPKQIKIEVRKLPEVPNICRQILREVWKSNKASIAHVIMEPNNVSLLHKHRTFTELYYILVGRGILFLGDRKVSVGKDEMVEIPPNTPHKLKNTGKGPLEHLVICIPCFNPKDIILLKERK